jgi:hypothetical protein
MSIKKQILALFQELPPDLREVVSGVLAIEQQNSSYKRIPTRAKDEIQNILERVATDNLNKENASHED